MNDHLKTQQENNNDNSLTDNNKMVRVIKAKTITQLLIIKMVEVIRVKTITQRIIKIMETQTKINFVRKHFS